MLTLTVTDLLIDPVGPVQLSVKLVVLVKAPVDSLPWADLVPDHIPDGTLEAEHDPTLLEVHVSVAKLPLVTNALSAFNESVGVVDEVTVTVTALVTEPPAPAQVSTKVLVTVNAFVDSLPDVPFGPDHLSEAEQEFALVEDHVITENAPLETLAGLALIVIVGGFMSGGGVLDAVPVAFSSAPPPPQAVIMVANTRRQAIPAKRTTVAPTCRSMVELFMS